MLRRRVIRTTVTIEGDEPVTFLSQDGRVEDVTFMRQDFSVKAFVNVGGNGLNTSNIKLYNLTDANSKRIEQFGGTVSLEAGWEGEVGLLFQGSISSVTRTKPAVTSPDIVTTLYCVSGLSALQTLSFSETIVNESLPSFLGRMAQNFELELTIDSRIQGQITNTAFNGDIVSVLTNLSTEFNFDFYITQNRLFISSPDIEGNIRTYNPENGLLDIPVVTEIGIDLKVFLDPQINTGDSFDLTSEFANFNIGGLEFLDRVRGEQVKTFGRQLNNNRYQGRYRALELNHEGSSHEDTWETSIRGQGLYNVGVANRTQRASIS